MFESQNIMLMLRSYNQITSYAARKPNAVDPLEGQGSARLLAWCYPWHYTVLCFFLLPAGVVTEYLRFEQVGHTQLASAHLFQ
eukprot:scaffold3505_cov21-Tisochrysis_lutea.AAC.1